LIGWRVFVQQRRAQSAALMTIGRKMDGRAAASQTYARAHRHGAYPALDGKSVPAVLHRASHGSRMRIAKEFSLLPSAR
jgi:hypothetical protein